MIILAGTNETLEVITSATASTDVLASYADITSTAFTAGSQQSNITTATTTTILAAPAASTQRQVKVLFITNKDSTNSQTITLQKNVGGTKTVIAPLTLLKSGEVLQYIDGMGVSVLDPFSRQKRSGSVALSSGTGSQVSASSWPVVIASDQASVPIKDGFTDALVADLNSSSLSGELGLLTQEPLDPANNSNPALSVRLAQQVQIDPTIPVVHGVLGPDGILRAAVGSTAGVLITEVSNFPASQPVSGSVSVSNLPAIQRVISPLSTLDTQNDRELLFQIVGALRALVHQNAQQVALMRGQIDPPLSEEADNIIGEYISPFNKFVNITT